MTARWLLLSRLVLRSLRQEPVRTALTALAVALGVGVVIAIDLAGEAAAGSFHSSLESLTGKDDLLITSTGGLKESLLGQLVRLPYAFEFRPRIEDFASINGRGEAIPFIGVDLIASAESDFYSGVNWGSTDLLSAGNPIWVTGNLGLQEGQRAQLLINDRLQEFTVARVFTQTTLGTPNQKLIVTDIGIAQRAAAKLGKLDSIDVRTPPGQSAEFWQALLRRFVPASVTVQPEGASTEENRKMLAAFRWNLHVLSYIALLVGGFLIYNTISISVVRRRNQIGVIRALGGTRQLILAGFLAEAMFFAVMGSAAGIVIGRLMATGAVGLIGGTVRALYVTSQPANIALTPRGIGVGVALGFIVSVLAAWAPALEAARVVPIEAMARGRHEYLLRIRSGVHGFRALVLFAIAGCFSRLPAVHRHTIFGYLAALLLIVGTAELIPGVIQFLASRLNKTLLNLFGVETLLAMRSLRASLSRTTILTAALATAVAMTVSVGIMVGSFRKTVLVWLNHEMQADFYLRPAIAAGADRHPTMSPDIADAIEKLPAVAAIDRFRAYAISYEGMPATLAGGQSSRMKDSAVSMFLPGEDEDTILRKLPTGDYVVVSEPFANKHNVHAGSILRIPLAGAVRAFTVLGIYYDYAAESGYITMDRTTLLKYLPDPAESGVAVYLKQRADADSVRAQINRIIGGKAVLLLSNRSLRQAAIQVFDRTFRITYALEAIAVIVAVIGIASALLAMVLDRRRDFALLRFLGAAQEQVRGIILCEAGLLGLLANGIGLLLGTALSLILIFVINKQSFGWTIQFHWPLKVLFLALTGVYVATVLAGLYPARTALRMQPIEVIHDE